MSDWRVYKPENPVILALALYSFVLLMAAAIIVTGEVAKLAEWTPEQLDAVQFALHTPILMGLWIGGAAAFAIVADVIASNPDPLITAFEGLDKNVLAGVGQSVLWLVVAGMALFPQTSTPELQRTLALLFIFLAAAWSPLLNWGVKWMLGNMPTSAEGV